MGNDVRLYQCDNYKNGFDEIERKPVLSQVTCHQLFNDHIDYFFSEYCNGLMKDSNKTSNEKGVFFQNIFEKYSFSSFIQKVGKEKIDQIVPDRNQPLSSEQIQDLIWQLQQIINDYCEKEKIDHRYTKDNQIEWHTPYGYGFMKLLAQEWYLHMQNIDTINSTPMWYAFESFFSSYLANIFFKKTVASLKKSEEISATLELERTINHYLVLLLKILATIENSKDRDHFAQWIYNLTVTKDFTLLDGKKFIEVFDDFLQAYEHDDHIDLIEIQEQAKGIFMYNFKKYLPAENDEPTVYLRDIGTHSIFVPKDNFYFDPIPTSHPIEEVNTIEQTLGMIWYMDPQYREKHGVLIKDASIFNALWEKVWRGDFDPTRTIDYTLLQNIYYILNQQESMHPGEWAILAQQKLRDSDIIKARFWWAGESLWLPWDSTDYMEPTKLKREYMTAKAVYKIANWILCKNNFAYKKQ